MHIAVVCRALGVPGAVASVALRQARELTRHAQITLVSDTFPDDTHGMVKARVPMPDLYALRRFRHVPDEVLFGRGARGVLQSLADVDFILVHAHSAAHIGTRGLGIPVGFFVHGDIFARPPGTYDSRLTAFYRWVAPRAYRTADVVLVLAPYLAGVAREHGARRVEVVPNGIDLLDLGIEQPVTRAASRPLRVIHVGRLAVEKGVDHLLAAMRMVNAQVTIVGSGPREADLRAAAADLPHVRFAGNVPRASLGELYSTHDVFVTATLNEGFALVVLEALACGLPVIATDIDANRAVVRHGENGLLVPPADPRAMADALEMLARDEELRARLASNAHASVLPRFNWTTIGDRIAEIARDVSASQKQ